MAREMKDSGIDWIGEIPKEWKCANFRYCGSFVKGKLPVSTNDQSKGLPIIGASEMLGKSCRTFTEETNIPLCTEDDILILWDGANAGIVANRLAGVVSSTAVKYRCFNDNSNNQFVYYMFKSAESFFKSKVNGTTIPHMNIQYINEIPLLVPPLMEQQRIAAYLDEKCGEIDSLISLQEKMIEELKAYKQSVITEAVTKGLNPNVKMKDSGVDWIGEIPEKWKLRRIKNIGSAKNGLTYAPQDVVGEDEGVLVLRSSNIQNGKLVFEDNIYVSTEIPKTLMVQKGDLIICSRNGSASLVGKCALVEDDKLIATYGAFMMRFHSIFNHRYIYYLLTCAITQYKQLFSTTTINQLTIGVFGSLIMPFTTERQEQSRISDFLDRKTQQIDSLIAIKQKKIDELKNYKKSLIYEYVTGKKEVV